ncbi:MAG: hypothetical protein AB1659_01120 [Thermodesulfobacteriota bacterium]
MNCTIQAILEKIGNDQKGVIQEESPLYLELNIGEEAAKMGCSTDDVPFQKTNVIVPLKRPVSGMKVMIDGRTFAGYAQLNSGVIIPGYVAKTTRLSYRAYIPHDSMILNFA